jgi:tetratricopeptide (TPR) repeat protein
MRTLTFGLLLFLAQPKPIDKNKVMDYFQNQQFDEAVAYLSPALAADSSDLTLLGYAGYAYYMNDHNEEAAGCYQRMLGVDSNNVTALHYLLLIRLNEDPGEAAALSLLLLIKVLTMYTEKHSL